MQLSKKQFNTLPLKQRQVLAQIPAQKRKNQKGKIPRGPRNGNGGNGVNGQNPLFVRQSRQGNNVTAAAASYSSVKTARAPQVSATREMCRIQHRELVGSVTGSVAFAVPFSLALNPGISATFPWLSGMATLWEEYQFSKLRFCYETRTGSNTPGSVLQAIDYDAADAAPSTEQVISSYQGAVEGAPWLPSICCDARGSSLSGFAKRRYLRTGALAANQDIKTYDVGNFFLATVDGTAVGWGKLYVEYDVTFFIPQLPPAGLPLLAGGQITGATTMTGANPFGVAPVVDAQAVGISIDAGSIVTFANPGTYLVSMLFQGTVITAVPAPTLVGITNLGGLAFVVNAAGTLASISFILDVTAANGTADFTVTATSITATIADIARAPALSMT